MKLFQKKKTNKQYVVVNSDGQIQGKYNSYHKARVKAFENKKYRIMKQKNLFEEVSE